MASDHTDNNSLANAARTTQFWVRAASIYSGYKLAQAQALGLKVIGWSETRIKEDHWDRHHERAGQDMYNLCVDLRGFFLKAGQFLGARGDFIPEQICRKLSLLHDQVPPMPADKVRRVIETELGGVRLENVFEWIDLDKPLGSASIAQVHKAKIKQPIQASNGRRWWSPLRILPFLNRGTVSSFNSYDSTLSSLVLRPEDESPAESTAMTGGLTSLVPFDRPPLDLDLARKEAPSNGIVAVKVQYPNALPTMSLDLVNLRGLAAFLSKTEIKFDLVSAVDELAKQIRLEFDFRREARIMDAVARQFERLNHKIEVPKSVPSMTTRQLLVMNFLDGVPITKMKDHIGFQNLSEATKRMAAKRILDRVSEAYGRMILLDGLFQADGHPGNILVMKGGKIGLIDYGQSKRLPDSYRAAFARVILSLETNNDVEISRALDRLGVETERDDVAVKKEMAVGMFDTTGKVDPFDPESPIKKMGIKTFPSDMFFVLRVVQLLRGLSNGMGIGDFSSAMQWRPFAKAALKELKDVALPVDCLDAHIKALE